MLSLNQKLNLVIPIYGPPVVATDSVSGKETTTDVISAYVHSAPISREVFDKFYLVIAKTFSAIYGEGLGYMAGPRVAAKLLRTVAEATGQLEEVQQGLIGEIRRLSNFIVPGQSSIPLEDAARTKKISDEDLEEVDNAITFFTVASSMHRREELRMVMLGASRLWGARTTSSNCTEFAASLSTSTAAESTGEKATPSSIPY